MEWGEGTPSSTAPGLWTAWPLMGLDCVLLPPTPDTTWQSDSLTLTAGPSVRRDPEAALGARSDVSFHRQWQYWILGHCF